MRQAEQILENYMHTYGFAWSIRDVHFMMTTKHNNDSNIYLV